nr:hypothetical protein [Methylomarinum sp. Ch1-1]MDP4521671.1 hypothetical protein [Methylomarinum sp. Ch1-1]
MTGRFRLFLVWFAGYTLSFLILSFYCFTGLAVEDLSEVLGSALVDMTGVFAPYLTPIVAFWFAKEVVQKAAPLPQGPYKVALICSLFYNITIVLLMSALFSCRLRRRVMPSIKCWNWPGRFRPVWLF